VNRTGVDESIVEFICQDLFQLNRELYAEEELDEAGNLIYQPSPLREVWLDEAGQQQGNKDCNSGVGTTTSCVIAIKQSNRLFLLLSQQTKMLMTILIYYLFLMMAV
jgi:hypothetical protein